jgi:hypothetical protein
VPSVPGRVTFALGKVLSVPGRVTFALGKEPSVPDKVTFAPDEVPSVPGRVTFAPDEVPSAPDRLISAAVPFVLAGVVPPLYMAPAEPHHVQAARRVAIHPTVAVSVAVSGPEVDPSSDPV